MRGTHAGPRALWRRRRDTAPPEDTWAQRVAQVPAGAWLPATMPGEYTAEMAAITAAPLAAVPELHHEEEAPPPPSLTYAVAAMLAAYRDNAAAMLAAAAAEWEQLLATYPPPEEA